MRSGNDAALILTGATGFLGGHLLAAFVERGDRVIALGRPSGGQSLNERIRSLLSWFALDGRRGQVETVEADFRMLRLGLEQKRYDALCARVGPIIHCASDTRFSERKRDEITEANIHGLQHMLDLAAHSRAPFSHYLSTAYVAGKTSGCCPEELADAIVRIDLSGM